MQILLVLGLGEFFALLKRGDDAGHPSMKAFLTLWPQTAGLALPYLRFLTGTRRLGTIMGCRRATFTDPTGQFELTSITRWVPLIAHLVSQILLFGPHTGVRVDDFPTLSVPSQIKVDISTSQIQTGPLDLPNQTGSLDLG